MPLEEEAAPGTASCWRTPVEELLSGGVERTGMGSPWDRIAAPEAEEVVVPSQ